MAIQPIDIQALFAQLANVGKSQAAIKDGQKIQESIQQMQAQMKLEENVRSVNEAQETGKDGTIKDEKGSGGDHSGHGGAKGKQPEEQAPAADASPPAFRDPALGRNVDLSG